MALLQSIATAAPRRCFTASAISRLSIAPRVWAASATSLRRRQFGTSQSTPFATLSFWKCRHTWRRAGFNTFRCLIGCSIGDLSTMWYLMSYHPDMDMTTSMGLSMAAGISTSIILETVLLSLGKDALPWAMAARTACGMSLISMLTMELTENLVTLSLADTSMTLSDSQWWMVLALSMAAGFATPLPYNYFRLKYFGKACH